MDIANLKFQRLIVHEAIKRTPENEHIEAVQSDSLVTLDEAGSAEVRARIANALGKSSHSVELDIDDKAPGSTFDLCTQMLIAPDAEFVELSQTLARKLSTAQSGAGSARSGLAVIIQGTITRENETKRIVLLIKADGESAFLKETEQGNVSLRLVTDLFLGPQQKLYKIGSFVELQTGEPSGDAIFEAHVFDHLMSDASDRSAAAYFYKIFLGCKLAESAKRRTRQFFEYTMTFINDMSLSKTDKVDLKNSLKVFLKHNQKPQFSVTDFADEYIRQEHRADYKKFMRNQKFPTSAVTKDIDAIKSKLRIHNVMFTSHVRISAPADEFASVIKIGEEVNGWTKVQVKGTIENQ